MKRIVLATLIFIIQLPESVKADVFRYVNDEGVECFTDAPQRKDAVMILKERTFSRGTGGKRTVPKHLQATGISETVAPLLPVTEQPSETLGTLPVHGRISSLVGLRHDPIDGTMREHKGVDIAVPSGTPVRPVASGRIIFAGVRPGYGNMVIVEQNDGVISLYAHNSVNLVSVGDSVSTSATIALTGSTGRSTGPHLHFEAWKDGVNITSSYVPGNESAKASPKSPHRADAITRFVQADGTIVFSNMR